jgi:hypothetical protein
MGTGVQIHRILSYFISLVWFVNGLIGKILNLVPRHEQIVSRILGNDNSRVLTILVGLSVLVMCGWMLCGFRKRF